MKCNTCWKDIDGLCYITKCNHVFCRDDTEKHFSHDMTCPACEKALSERDIRKVDGNSGIEEKAFVLCGYPPEVVLDALRNALKFWDLQKELEIKYQQYLLREQVNSSQQKERGYHDKLVEASSRLQVAVKRLETSNEEHDMTRKEFEELQNKYQDKVREKSKLEELYNILKRRYDQACRENANLGIRMPGSETNNSSSTTGLFLPSSDKSQPTIIPSNSGFSAPIRPSFHIHAQANGSHMIHSHLPKNDHSPNFLQRKSPSFLSHNSTHTNIKNQKEVASSSMNPNKFSLLSANQKLLFTPLKRPRPSSPGSFQQSMTFKTSNPSL